MLEASAAAADAALENVESVYASSSRIFLDIDLKVFRRLCLLLEMLP